MIPKIIPVYWFRSSNFGDCIAPYLVEKITGDKAIYVSNSDLHIEHIALIGSLLDSPPLSSTHVWGCGFVYESGHTFAPKSISAVRGALSRQRYLLNEINCPEVYGDPALLLPNYFNPEIQKKYRVGIIPHVVDYIKVLEAYSNRYDDVLIINLSNPVEFVIEQILSCEKTISSSLHGLVVSHAYNIPSQWVEFSENVTGEGFKFRDYFTTVETNKSAVDLKAIPDLKSVFAAIPEHKISVDLNLLIENCPLCK